MTERYAQAFRGKRARNRPRSRRSRPRRAEIKPIDVSEAYDDPQSQLPLLAQVRGCDRCQQSPAQRGTHGDAESAQAAQSHTGALAGADDVFDAALARAGVVRVDSFDALFSVVETLARVRRVEGVRLLIVTNGGGADVMAVDALVRQSGSVATLSDEGHARLNAVLPGDMVARKPSRHHRRCAVGPLPRGA